MFIFFIQLIPVPKNILLKILYGIGCAILGFIGLIISGIATIIPFGILLNKIRYNLPEMRKEFIKKDKILAWYLMTLIVYHQLH